MEIIITIGGRHIHTMQRLSCPVVAARVAGPDICPMAGLIDAARDEVFIKNSFQKELLTLLRIC
jgi:hypothetical protein